MKGVAAQHRKGRDADDHQSQYDDQSHAENEFTFDHVASTWRSL